MTICIFLKKSATVLGKNSMHPVCKLDDVQTCSREATCGCCGHRTDRDEGSWQAFPQAQRLGSQALFCQAAPSSAPAPCRHRLWVSVPPRPDAVTDSSSMRSCPAATSLLECGCQRRSASLWWPSEFLNVWFQHLNFWMLVLVGLATLKNGWYVIRIMLLVNHPYAMIFDILGLSYTTAELLLQPQNSRNEENNWRTKKITKA